MTKAQAHKDTREPEVIEELSWDDVDAVRLLCGERDRNLRAVERRYRLTIHPRGNRLRLIGSRTAVQSACALFDDLYQEAVAGRDPSELIHGAPPPQEASVDDVVLVTYKNRRLGAKTPRQQEYVDAIRNQDIVFGVGPAGTGKTYLAVLMGVQNLLAGSLSRVILTRPAVEAGERLGFLPGDLAEKVNPYLRPLYDALHDMLPFDEVRRMVENGVIEVAPLAFMRGRTLSDAFVILDEAQNTTPEQMKMFLTRLGPGGRVVVTGDVTQTDLPPGRESGLRQAMRVLQSVEGVAFVEFGPEDVVRHRIVQRIIDAYERETVQEPKLPFAEFDDAALDPIDR